MKTRSKSKCGGMLPELNCVQISGGEFDFCRKAFRLRNRDRVVARVFQVVLQRWRRESDANDSHARCKVAPLSKHASDIPNAF